MRTASKHSTTSDMAEKPANKELHLSGSLIRSFVRQLSSSRSKEIMNPVYKDGKVSDASSHDLANFTIAHVEPQQRKSDLRSSSQYKKQVRRRNHTSKPYQERVINMAEARREIVSALKLHRAAMKSSSQLQKQELLHSVQELSSLPSQLSRREFLDQVSSGRDTGIYPSSGSILNCFNNTYFPSNSRASNYWSQNNNPARSKHTGPICSRSPSQVVDLNFHDMNMTAPPNNNTGEGSLPYHCMPSKPWAEIPGISFNSGHTMKSPEEIAVDKLHPVMNEDEIAAIRLIGEQHDMEWNDRMNLSTTAWWCSILKNLEKNSQEKCGTEGTMDDTGVFTGAVTPWINGQRVLNETSNELRTEGIGIGLLDEMATIPTQINCQQVSDEINSQVSHFQDETSSW